jgi:hypothetical protein
MGSTAHQAVEAARSAALEILLYNTARSGTGMPRTAAWEYPEPYTRDIMISAPGLLLSGRDELISGLKKTLEAIARNQTKRGLVPGLANDPEDLGSSDTTPLFLIGLALYRSYSGERAFLDGAARKALAWMEYQSPDDRVMVGQQPTSDWRDEQWVEGYGLFVNTLYYIALRLHGYWQRAEKLRQLMNRLTVTAGHKHAHVHEGLHVTNKPYYALWSLKIHSSERFDLVGNSLAIIAGIPSRRRAGNIVSWIESECRRMRESGQLSVDLPPNLFPYIEPDHPDWRRRYADYNRPGEYHNGGIWPFACALHITSQVAAGRLRSAKRSLGALAQLVKPSRRGDLEYGFNEWYKAIDGAPGGQDWQTWSAALFLYAAACVERGSTPFFDGLRKHWNKSR